MTTDPTIQSEVADQLAASLRNQRPKHDDSQCDALFPCADCRLGREAVQIVRAQARVPQQRSAS